MFLIKKLAGLQFKYANIINFKLVKFVIIKINKTMAKNIIDYLEVNKDNS